MTNRTDVEDLPYRDQRLTDRKGELWMPVPGLGDYFHVSDHGRVKRLKRLKYDALGRPFTTAEKIIIPSINRSPNTHLNDFSYRFQVQVQINNNIQSFQVQRMVYYCFVEPFDLKDKRLCIVVRKGNGLDIRPANLQKINLEEKSRRPYERGRQVATYLYDPSYKAHAAGASVAVTSKQVSRYTLKGKWDRSFSSMMDASKKTGLKYEAISAAVRRHWQTPGGYYWRWGEEKVIAPVSAPKKDYRESRGTRVTQFDLNGHPVGWFLALSEAAKAAGVDHKTLREHINGKGAHAGGFVWRFGHQHNKLDLKKPDGTK